MRKTFDFSDEMYAWYKAKADSLNIPVSALMIMAMNEYIKQESGIQTMSDIMKEINKSNEQK